VTGEQRAGGSEHAHGGNKIGGLLCLPMCGDMVVDPRGAVVGQDLVAPAKRRRSWSRPGALSDHEAGCGRCLNPH
jgi:hypothetical protein